MEAKLKENARQMMQGMENRMGNNMNENLKENARQMKEETNGMRGEMKKTRGEMRQVGQCLQADRRELPRATTSELKGSAPAGEDRVIRATCWGRRVEVIEEATVTKWEKLIRETCRTRHEVTKGKKLNGVTETCTTRREVTELTKTRETVEERLHGVEEKDGVEEEKDAHTHTHIHT